MKTSESYLVNGPVLRSWNSMLFQFLSNWPRDNNMPLYSVQSNLKSTASKKVGSLEEKWHFQTFNSFLSFFPSFSLNTSGLKGKKKIWHLSFFLSWAKDQLGCWTWRRKKITKLEGFLLTLFLEEKCWLIANPRSVREVSNWSSEEILHLFEGANLKQRRHQYKKKWVAGSSLIWNLAGSWEEVQICLGLRTQHLIISSKRVVTQRLCI